jgi:multiple sugar transport system permease protein
LKKVVLYKKIKKILFYLLLFSITGIIIFPFYWMIVQSIQKESVFSWPPKIIPKGISFKNYLNIFYEKPMVIWLLNTCIVTLTTTIISILVSIGAGFSLSRFRNYLNLSLGFIILITQMLPATLLVIPMYIIYKNLGLIDTLESLILSNIALTLPLSIWMMKGFFDSIPRELDEAARLDGCSIIQLLYKIILPINLPGIVAVSVFVFMLSWNEFFFARTFLSSQNNWVLSVGLSSFVEEYVVKWNSMIAAGVIFAFPPVFFFMLVQKYLLHGLTGGALKE